MSELVPLARRAALPPRAPALAHLSAARLDALAGRMEWLQVPAGAVLLRQGEPAGDVCYVLGEGQVEVVLHEESGRDRRLATLTPGTLFGEIALLADTARTATVRTLEPCTLLALRRADLVEVLGADQRVRGYFLDLLHTRQRPRRAPGILVHRQPTPTGDTVVTLKDARRGAYYRLSPQGWFLWQRLDGQHTVRDLIMEYAREYQRFAPEAIVHLVADLTAAGFASAPRLRANVVRAVGRVGPWTRAAQLARRALTWRVALGGVDGPIGAAYRAVAHPLFTGLGQVLLALLAVAGLVAFALDAIAGAGHVSAGHHPTSAGPGDATVPIVLGAAYLLSVVTHEAGHAFTTKAFGYSVPSVGVGWFWFSPVAFVDTSEMWLAGRWPRVAVSLAGPYANVLLGGAAALAARFAPGGATAAAFWQIALVSYLLVFLNLNPLLEYDGYYILMDLLECPNLRPRALAWLGAGMRALWRRTVATPWRSLLAAYARPGRPPRLARARVHQRPEALQIVFVLYGLGAVLYVAIMALVTVFVYRVLFQGWVGHLVPAAVASALAWAVAGALVLLCAAGVAGELAGVRSPARGTP